MKTKILAKHHSGRLRPHHHTSYGSLLVILLMAASVVILVQQAVSADTSGSGSAGVFAVVPDKIITKPAIITNLSNGQVFQNNNPITVNGTCLAGSLIKIYDDEAMSGATLCNKGSFTLQMSLFLGGNSLIARSYNSDDIPGPDSTPVTVQLSPPGVSLPPFNPNQPPIGQFYLTTDVYYRGGRPGDNMSWQITPIGGKPPYAVNVKWGDGNSDVFSSPNDSQFTISHAYSKPAAVNGTYTVIIKATDQAGNTSTLQIFALIPGAVPAAATSSSTTNISYRPSINTVIEMAWRTLIIVAFISFFFWYFEKRKHFSLHHHVIK